MSWWVVEADIGASQGPTFQVIQSAAKPDAAAVITAQHTSTKVTGPFASQAAAQAAVPKNAHTGPVTPQVLGGASPQAPNVGNAIPGLQQIGDFFSRLGNSNTWLRAGEVILGLLLIAVGVAKMTNAVPVATKIAKAVA